MSASYKAHRNKVCPTKVGRSNTLLVGDDLLERGEQRADQTTDSIWLEFIGLGRFPFSCVSADGCLVLVFQESDDSYDKETIGRELPAL